MKSLGFPDKQSLDILCYVYESPQESPISLAAGRILPKSPKLKCTMYMLGPPALGKESFLSKPDRWISK